MKGVLQKSFFPILVLIVLVGSIALVNEIVDDRRTGVPSIPYQTKEIINTTPGGPNINNIPGPTGDEPNMNTSTLGYKVIDTGNGTYFFWDFSLPSIGPGTSVEPAIKHVNEGTPNLTELNHREAVIVYFKITPTSVNEFASSYGVKPIFAKENISMVAFETSPNKKPGVTSQKTLEFIEQVSKDPNVVSVKEDTYMFINKNDTISVSAKVTYPEDLDRSGIEYAAGEVIVGFWRIPPFSAFCAKRGVTLDNVTETNNDLQYAIFKIDKMNNFINSASRDPYVRYVKPYVIGQVT